MILISAKDIAHILDYRELVSEIRSAFAGGQIFVPLRQNLNLPHNNTSLIMPAWNDMFYGLKQVTVCPNNNNLGLPTIQGRYDLFDVRNGQHLAAIDAAKLTAVRTAATSVLASSFFAVKPMKLVILGNGVIASHLSEAYNAFYSLEGTVIWSRSLASEIDLEKEVKNADIISCATHAYEPILQGKWVNGQSHIDLVGSYKPNMREADDALIAKCEIYVDDLPAITESGDLALPIEAGIIAEADIRGTLFALCQNEKRPLKGDGPTLFKSVGHAIEDLAAAIYLYEKIHLKE